MVHGLRFEPLFSIQFIFFTEFEFELMIRLFTEFRRLFEAEFALLLLPKVGENILMSFSKLFFGCLAAG